MRFKTRFIPTSRDNRGSGGTRSKLAGYFNRPNRTRATQAHCAKMHAQPQPLAMPRQRPPSAAEAAALAIAVQRFAAHAGVTRELRAMVGSTNCAARYAALLDLAELARRDGTSSEVVMRGLSHKGGARGAMDECPRLNLGE